MVNAQVLVLNSSYTPIYVTSLLRAFSLLRREKAEVVSVEENYWNSYNLKSWEEVSFFKKELEEENMNIIRGSEDYFIEVPKVVRLIKFAKIPFEMKLTRKNIFLRDNNTCFIPNTKILMSNGDIKNIEDIEIGDKVLNADGKEEVVEFVNKRYVDEELILSRHTGNGDFNLSTKEHKFLPYYKEKKDYDKEGVEIQNLTLNDSLFCPLIKYKEDELLDHTIDLYKYKENLNHISLLENNKYIKHYSSNPIKRYFDLDFKIGILFGFYLAEGSSVNGQTTFSFHIKEKEHTDLIKEILKEKLGYEAKEKELPDRNVRIIQINSKIFSNFIISFLYKNGEKRLAEKRYNIDFLKGVLYGVVLGDGNINEELSRITVMMKTENLIRDLYIVSNLCDIFPTLSKTGFRKDGRIYKSIIYNAYEYNKIINLIGKGNVYTKESKVDRFFNDGKIISKLKQLKEVPYKGLVYDLQVSGSHTYIANFTAVHNCQYCSNEKGSKDLNIDHIIPKSKGGKNTWENLVCACIKCNSKKGARTPKEAGMKLISKPKKPSMFLMFKHYIQKMDEEPFCDWKHFFPDDIISDMYWNTELQQ
ncbi:MAG: HNH endonuclease [bacterium]